ncbi:MAG: hypothetical protein OXF54_14120 [Caldilineaceae bacterium]|nr:hypothetical protein [Caldilineaceae bacterium]
MYIHNGGPRQRLEEIVLFPFDDHSLPLQCGVELHLEGHMTPCGRTRIAVDLGEEGAPDSERVVYYGTVHRVGDELWMWYLGQGRDAAWFERVCFATSTDGYNWHKPNLGLVEYNGSRDNNLVDLNQGSHHVQSCVVYHDPDDPDPDRKFKMLFQSRKYDSSFAAAFSADGLSWQESSNNPVGSWLEMAGGTRHNGCYYICGQGGTHAGGVRQLVTHISYDFENWSQASCMGMRRSNVSPRSPVTGSSAGEQIHLGASLWNRGNVIVGFYGMWNGHPSNDRRLVTMDLGLAVSNDALHYREPIPDYPIVSAAEDGWQELPHGNTLVNYPALIQGQGFEQVGDETLFWYAPWPEQSSDGVRVASWPRDRLGYLQPLPAGRMRPGQAPHIVSAPIDLDGKPAQLALNIDGLGDYSDVTAEIITEQLEPVPGYSAADCIPPSASGLSQPVAWRGRDTVQHENGPIRLRLNFSGIRPEDIQLFAAYMNTVGG